MPQFLPSAIICLTWRNQDQQDLRSAAPQSDHIQPSRKEEQQPCSWSEVILHSYVDRLILKRWVFLPSSILFSFVALAYNVAAASHFTKGFAGLLLISSFALKHPFQQNYNLVE